MDYISHYHSPLGDITVASDGNALIGLWFDGQKHFTEIVDNNYKEYNDLPVFSQTFRWLDIYFNGRDPGFMPPVIIRGSDFNRRVLNFLITVPYGCTITYGAVATALSCRSSQAVGRAVGNNPISIIIPCHRVIGSSGSLTGYSGGLERKERLLMLEGII